MESFTAYLTLQVLWKTSRNTGFFFFFPCLAAAWTASSHLYLHSHKKRRGLLGFMATEQYTTTVQISLAAKPLPQHGATTTTKWALLKAGALSIQCSESSTATRRQNALTAAPKVGLNHQGASPDKQSAKSEPRLGGSAFSFSAGWMLRLITPLPAVPQGCVILNYTPCNHGESCGPISYE